MFSSFASSSGCQIREKVGTVHHFEGITDARSWHTPSGNALDQAWAAVGATGERRAMELHSGVGRSLRIGYNNNDNDMRMWLIFKISISGYEASW